MLPQDSGSPRGVQGDAGKHPGCSAGLASSAGELAGAPGRCSPWAVPVASPSSARGPERGGGAPAPGTPEESRGRARQRARRGVNRTSRSRPRLAALQIFAASVLDPRASLACCGPRTPLANVTGTCNRTVKATGDSVKLTSLPLHLPLHLLPCLPLPLPFPRRLRFRLPLTCLTSPLRTRA
jgi:hypothetical protein